MTRVHRSGDAAQKRADITLTPKSYAVRVMVAEAASGYSLGGEKSFREMHMVTPSKKITNKLDDIAEKAKDGAGKVAEKVIDAANNVAHAATEKARQGTENVGEKLIDVGEKITKMAK